jgi:hypothetical protein
MPNVTKGVGNGTTIFGGILYDKHHLFCFYGICSGTG